ncbi:unnamed protein product [Diamesa serratosioi]
MEAGRLVGRMVARNILSKRNYGGNPHFKPTMSDLPKPEGDFFALAAKRNRKYNGFLYGGILTFATTLYITIQSNLLHFNYTPPSAPAEE